MINQTACFSALDHRGVVAVAGDDARDFLQGLLSNDLSKGGPGLAQWAALLTPQGKFLHEMFVAEPEPGVLWLDCEAARRADLLRRLTIYKLRAKLTIADLTDTLGVFAAFDRGASDASDRADSPGCVDALGLAPERGSARAFADGIAFVDPRFAAAGARIIAPRTAAAALKARGLIEAPASAWDAHRLGLGLPDGSGDLPAEKALLLESGFEELAGVSFEKGCYVGQELTARTKHRGLVKRRLMTVDIAGPAPEPGAQILLDGADAGEMRSSAGGVGLALIRLDAWTRARDQGTALTAGAARLHPRKPAWAALP